MKKEFRFYFNYLDDNRDFMLDVHAESIESAVSCFKKCHKDSMDNIEIKTVKQVKRYFNEVELIKIDYDFNK